MTIRDLPAFQTVKPIDGLHFDPGEKAMDEWAPPIAAEDEDDETTITMFDVIGGDFFGEGVTAKRINGALRRIGNRDVTVKLNSPGGNYFEGVAIYNLLREHKGRVTIKIMSLAASAASVIAMSGDRIEIGEASNLMIHNTRGLTFGDRQVHLETAELLEQLDEGMRDVYAKRAGADASQVAAWMDAETWFGGKKAIEAGLADALLSSDEDEDPASPAEARSPVLAVRQVENILARHGMSRSQRRSLLGELTSGTPRAAHRSDAPRDAGATKAGLSRLIETIRPTPTT